MLFFKSMVEFTAFSILDFDFVLSCSMRYVRNHLRACFMHGFRIRSQHFYCFFIHVNSFQKASSIYRLIFFSKCVTCYKELCFSNQQWNVQFFLSQILILQLPALSDSYQICVVNHSSCIFLWIQDLDLSIYNVNTHVYP